MRKADEIAFYDAVRRARAQNDSSFVDAIAVQHGFNEKQAMAWVDKWDRKGWWDYGVSLRSGWFTPEAPTELTP